LAALTDRLVHSLKMLMKKPHTSLVCCGLPAVCQIVRDAIFGDQDFGRPIVFAKPREDVVEALRINLLPASGGDRMNLNRLTMIVDDNRRIVVNS
jgi:hypothetical protein